MEWIPKIATWLKKLSVKAVCWLKRLSLKVSLLVQRFLKMFLFVDVKKSMYSKEIS